MMYTLQMHFIYLANVLFALVSDFPSLFPPTQQEGSMEMCSLSVTRTPPLTASVIAAASATPSAWRTKVMLPSTPVLCNCTCHCFNTWVCVYVLAVLQVGGVVFFLFFLSACAVSPALSEDTAQASVDLRRLGVLPGGESSEDAAQEDFQYKLKGFIDNTVDKR